VIVSPKGRKGLLNPCNKIIDKERMECCEGTQLPCSLHSRALLRKRCRAKDMDETDADVVCCHLRQDGDDR
jgi:hypothetical protein